MANGSEPRAFGALSPLWWLCCVAVAVPTVAALDAKVADAKVTNATIKPNDTDVICQTCSCDWDIKLVDCSNKVRRAHSATASCRRPAPAPCTSPRRAEL